MFESDIDGVDSVEDVIGTLVITPLKVSIKSTTIEIDYSSDARTFALIKSSLSFGEYNSLV